MAQQHKDHIILWSGGINSSAMALRLAEMLPVGTNLYLLHVCDHNNPAERFQKSSLESFLMDLIGDRRNGCVFLDHEIEISGYVLPDTDYLLFGYAMALERHHMLTPGFDPIVHWATSKEDWRHIDQARMRKLKKYVTQTVPVELFGKNIAKREHVLTLGSMYQQAWTCPTPTANNKPCQKCAKCEIRKRSRP